MIKKKVRKSIQYVKIIDINLYLLEDVRKYGNCLYRANLKSMGVDENNYK
jgi:hypothetical protein